MQFAQMVKRNAVLEKAKHFSLNGNEVGLHADALFYMNEHLCSALKNLHSKTTAKK